MTYRVQIKGVSGCIITEHWTDQGTTFPTLAAAKTYARTLGPEAVRILAASGKVTHVAKQRPTVVYTSEAPTKKAPRTAAERAKLDQVGDLLTADPAKVRRAFEEDIRKDRPEVTREQLDAEWGLVQATFGLGGSTPVTKPGKRELVVLEPVENVKTPEGADAFASGIADKVVEIMNERRARKGLPPLRKD